MKVRVLQHVPFEDIGSMAGWFESGKAEIAYTRFFAGWELPRLEDVDVLVVLGGPMSVNDERVFPWLAPEKRFIGGAVRSGIPVLGICLGAQLIASSLGSKVYPNGEKEIGWFDVEAVTDSEGCFRFPDRVKAFHWHGETFDLPPGASPLAKSEACENQAFQIGERTIGLQFHLETTRKSIEDLLDNCRTELAPGRFVQSERSLLLEPPSSFETINRLMTDVLTYLTADSPGRAGQTG